ncbi:hypothetical protein CR513_14013, partial [Mucuna pruriens]
MDRSMIDIAIGGAVMDKTPTAALHLILNMVNNTQQFGTRGTIAPRIVNELAIGQHQPFAVVNACGICTSVEHPTDMCPTLQETESDHLESVGSIGGY